MQEAKGLVLSYMEGLGGGRALTVAILFRYGEWDQITSLEVDPLAYNDADSYWRASAASDLLRKVRDFSLDVDPKAVALQKWWAAEHQCYQSNERLSPYLYGSYPVECEGIASFFEAVRKKIAFWIGWRPPYDLQGRFGPGATYSNPATECLVPDKLSSSPTFTPDSWHYLIDWVSTSWASACAESGRSPQSVRGNIYFSVPKTARSERPCGKEPSLNGFFQLGVGRALRARLKLVGFDLEMGQETHRQVACMSSKDGILATLDLSSASDTICSNLVKLLLPPAWYKLLNDLRSPFTRVKGKWVRLEKFSSMGNGYTFELETLVFAALTACAMEDDALPGVNLFVYGDDIIMPSSSFDRVRSVLEYCGFSLNPRKSFHKGVFRESCGGDFFNGVAVRPFLLDSFPTEPSDYIAWANGLRRTAQQSGVPLSCDPPLYRSWLRILDRIPGPIRKCRGPELFGDLVIHDLRGQWMIRTRGSRRYLRTYRPIGFTKIKWEGWGAETQLATALYLSGGDSPVPGGLTPNGTERRWLVPRGSPSGYKLGWTSLID